MGGSWCVMAGQSLPPWIIRIVICLLLLTLVLRNKLQRTKLPQYQFQYTQCIKCHRASKKLPNGRPPFLNKYLRYNSFSTAWTAERGRTEKQSVNKNAWINRNYQKLQWKVRLTLNEKFQEFNEFDLIWNKVVIMGRQLKLQRKWFKSKTGLNINR